MHFVGRGAGVRAAADLHLLVCDHRLDDRLWRRHAQDRHRPADQRLFVYPGAIAIFTTIVTKFIATRRTGCAGRASAWVIIASSSTAIVLVGYDPDRTPRMLDELCADAEPGQQDRAAGPRKGVRE
jgi:hypothetical protein